MKEKLLSQVTDMTQGALSRLLPLNALSSYKNERLEDETFLNSEHIETLREESEITHWQLLETERIPGIGELRKIGIVTEHGYAYAGFMCVPEKAESDVPIIGTSAWFTSIEGHNEHSIRNLVRAGNYVFFLGAEGSYEPEIKTQPKSPVSLASSAAAVLNFSYHCSMELLREGYDVDTEGRIVVGESRGAMVGMGIAALAEEFAQRVLFADLTAPCLPRRMELADIRYLSEQLVSEPREIMKLLGSLTLGRLVHYPATLDLSPYSLRHQIAIGFALFSGEAGALGKEIPNSTLLHITAFEKDFASMKSDWEEIFLNNQNVRITPLPGSHLTLADLETLKFIIGRNKAIQICIAENEPATIASVIEAAHLFAPMQQPLEYDVA